MAVPVRPPYNPFLPPIPRPNPMYQEQPSALPPARPAPPMPPPGAPRSLPGAASALPPGAPSRPPMGGVAPMSGGTGLGGDTGLGFAAGVLEGGTTGQALGRGFRYALGAREAAKDRADKLAIAQASGSGGKFGMQPIYGKDEKGNYVVGQFKPDGGIFWNGGEGRVTPVSPYELYYQQASGRTAGTGEGDAIKLYKSMESKLPGLETVVSQLDDLADKATYTYAGQMRDELFRQTGQEPTQGAIARASYIAMVDNQILPLLRDTFGAQFTVQEGESLRATLGDPNKAPAEKKEVLKAFIEQKRRSLAETAREAGLPPPELSGSNSLSPSRPITEMSDDELQAIINGP